MALGFVNTGGGGSTSKIEKRVVLEAAKWAADKSYSIDFSDLGLSGDETYFVGVAMDASEDEKFDFSYAEISAKSQSTSGIVLQCQTVPVENIPLVITILK